ncbi:alcohol dehydrogenase-12 [Coleophoma cylindrospora]|uniref:Alcohol dehydrogenase-12 n=1 Tax=Coleophoma cylindrospora TaxID=1849047 RepID=A0A3D8QKP3_9HELO|nr:alcohol dehydrogenase-12 [Coleophoma cylindrospora]
MALSNLTTMRGVVYNGIPFNMTVQDLPVPTIVHATDAIVKITTSALCGSDLHVYHGVNGGTPPWNMGHEAMGYVAEIGSSVSWFNVGDYVVIPDTISTGHLEMEPEAYSFFGNGAELTQGLQSEYALVPFADANLIPIPLSHNTTNATIEQDYLTVSDIFGTAWSVIDWSGFQPGDTVAVFGAGPVGLLAAYSAILRGASAVYSVDRIQDRLDRAASIGAIPINFVSSDPVEQILAHQPAGVMRAVDCVGMEAVNAQLETQQDLIINEMVAVTHLGGGIAQVGVTSAQTNSAGAPLGDTFSPNVTFPMSDFFSKRLSFQSGPVDPKEIAPMLVDLIASGKAAPGFISSAQIGIEEAPEYYQRFDQHEEIKVYIRFP